MSTRQLTNVALGLFVVFAGVCNTVVDVIGGDDAQWGGLGFI